MCEISDVPTKFILSSLKTKYLDIIARTPDALHLKSEILMAKEFELSSTDSIPIDINFQRIIAQITRERNQSLRTKPHSSLKRYYCNRF